jgi:signal transduction histidine kinase
LERAHERAMLERFGGELEAAIDELRDLARGVYPQLLGELGIGGALEAVARHSAMSVKITDDGLTRHSAALETTVYFCCVECLQNAGKHAGPGASVSIWLRERDGHVLFSVDDDGVGFDPRSVQRGLGLTHLADRVAAVGGTLEIDSRPGRGTRIAGALPTYGT